MNKKFYWKLRKLILGIAFRGKAVVYRVSDTINGNREYRSFRGVVAKGSMIEIIKVLILIILVLWLDKIVLKLKGIPVVNQDMVVPIVIGSVSVAGIILGLYCANIASIFSSRYTNAPRNISIAFQYDKLTRRCITGIVDYIIFGLLVLTITLMGHTISWSTILVFIIMSIVVIISYSIAGNRAYQLSDVYGIAADSNRILYRIVTKWVNHNLFSSDMNLQNHFLKAAEKQINLLKSIQTYGAGINKKNNIDNTVVTEFMGNILVLIVTYWKSKKDLNKSSLWFRENTKYQRWHFADEAELSIALKTGAPLQTKGEHNYWWFEEELISINKSCLDEFFDQCDYSSIYRYMISLKRMCSIAVECKEVNFYVEHIDWIKKKLELQIDSIETDFDKENAFAGVMDIISLLYLDLILESSRVYQGFNFEKNVSQIIKSIDSGKDAENSKYVRNRQDIDFYKKIITEIQVEGERVTPIWIIKQKIAKEEFVYLNSLLDIVREGMDQVFSLGKRLSERQLYFEACIIVTRYYEYESKLTRFIKIIEQRKEELVSYQVDNEDKWDAFRLQKLLQTIEKWKKTVPELLMECSTHFAFETWKSREEYPDFLGECYNYICEDSIEAIINGDINQFEIDFKNLSKLMILYQEYIRTDFITNKDLYRVEYAYYMFTSPIVEWAQIGGLAILWGEFHADEKWKECVSQSIEFIKGEEPPELAERLIEYVQHRNQFMIGIASRDILETGWQQSVANTIRDSGICEEEYEMFGRHLKTDSLLLSAFCPDFMEMGFTNDPAEVFWIICINPLLNKDKQYHTRFSWEDRLNDKDALGTKKN